MGSIWSGRRMKLIKTKLLQEYHHNSPVGIATASHIDFCKYQVRCLKPDWIFEEQLITLICSFFGVLSIPLLLLTNGLILYPFWMIVHIIETKKIVKKFGASTINKSAEELVKEMRERKE